MNKKLMAVAVAGAFGAVAAPTVALAQSSTVQMFGTINLIYGYYDNGGFGLSSTGTANATQKLRYDAMNESESEIGVKGEEALGGGTSAWFQCLSSFDVTGNRGANGTGGWCGRNSAFGLKGGFGNAFVGNWDTPNKVVMSNYRVFALNYPMGIGMLYNGASSDVGSANANVNSVVGASVSMSSQFVAVGGGASFSRRQTRLLSYVTPEMSGFQGSIAFSAANEASANTQAVTAQKPRLFSLGLNYTNGPLGLGYGFESHKDYNAFAVTSASIGAAFQAGSDYSHQLGAGYTFMGGDLRVNALWARLHYAQTINNQGIGTIPDLTLNQTNWNLNGEWKVSGPHIIRLGYTKAGNTTGNAGSAAAGGTVMVGALMANGGAGGTGASKYSFEYAYAMSKRTELSLGYARVNNDGQSNQTVGTGATAPGFGDAQSYLGLRAKHSF